MFYCWTILLLHTFSYFIYYFNIQRFGKFIAKIKRCGFFLLHSVGLKYKRLNTNLARVKVKKIFTFKQ